MRKASVLILLMLLVSVFTVSSITLTRDATELVRIPVAIRAEVCPWDETISSCIGASEEIVFGHALVYPIRDPPLSESFDMEIFVFDGNVYRSTSLSTVVASSLYNETELQVMVETNGGERPEELNNIIGIKGRLSLVNPDGTEIYATGETRIVEDEKGSYTEEVPIGEFTINYSETNGIGRYEHTYDEEAAEFNRELRERVRELGIDVEDKNAYLAAGLPSFREEYVLTNDPFGNLTLRSYTNLIFTLDKRTYKLQRFVSSAENLEWTATCRTDADCEEGRVCVRESCRNLSDEGDDDEE